MKTNYEKLENDYLTKKEECLRVTDELKLLKMDKESLQKEFDHNLELLNQAKA